MSTHPPDSTLTRPAEEISRDEILARLGDSSLALVNVLPADAFARGHIPGSIHLPLSDLRERAPLLLTDRSQEIAVYCAAPT